MLSAKFDRGYAVLHPIFGRCIFFFNAPAPTEIYTLSLHDALPICSRRAGFAAKGRPWRTRRRCWWTDSTLPVSSVERSEEHTSELQSQFHLVCRLLLEKKKKPPTRTT